MSKNLDTHLMSLPFFVFFEVFEAILKYEGKGTRDDAVMQPRRGTSSHTNSLYLFVPHPAVMRTPRRLCDSAEKHLLYTTTIDHN